MAWDRKPKNGADIQAWFFVRQFYHAIADRFCMASGDPHWPASNTIYESGIVGSITSTTMTDGSTPPKDWSSFPSGCSGTSRWFNVTCGGDPKTARFYDLIIEGGGPPGTQPDGTCGDETKVIRARITGGTATTVTFADAINDYITAGIISSLSELAGKRYYIIGYSPSPGDGRGMFWADRNPRLARWADWPNGFPSQEQIAAGDKGKQELWFGTVSSARAFSITELYDVLTNKNALQFKPNTPQAWDIDQWKGADLLVYRSDGYLARKAVTGNSADTIFFDNCIYKLIVGGTIEPGDLFNIAFQTASGTAAVTVAASSSSAATTASEIASAINSSASPIVTGVATAAASGATITLTGVDPAKWFVVRVTTTESTGATADGQTFILKDPDPGDVVASGAYSVMEKGGRGFPGRRPNKNCWWYCGYQEPYYSHFPDDSIVSLPMPVAEILIARGTVEPCDPPEFEDIFDLDYYIPGDDVCADQGADVFLTPYLFKSRRALQNVVRGLIGSNQFVDLERLAAGNPKTTYKLASAFKQAGVNGQTTRISTVDNGTHVASISRITMPRRTPAEAPQTSMEGLFEIIDDDGTVLLEGTGTFTATTFQFGSALTDAHNGKRVDLSWGESRFWPRRYGRHYDQSCWIPFVETTDEGTTVFDPVPDPLDLDGYGCLQVGTWIHRGRSTTYQEFSELGFAGDSAQAFLDGELARYAGSHWAQPDVGLGPAGLMTEKVGPGNDDIAYWDHFTVGRHKLSVQAILDGARSGKATAGGTNFLRDSGKNWYASVWYDISKTVGGVMRVERGTASSGSTTQITDNGKTNLTTDQAHCFFDPARFVNFPGAYVGFPIIITQTRSGVTTSYRSVITSTSQTSAHTVINFRAVAGMPAVTAGDTYDITEAYEVNRWQGRTLRVKKPDGTELTATIKWSDDQTLFFDDLPNGATVDATDIYNIDEVQVGRVLKWDAATSSWVEPIPGDADPRGPTPGRSDDGIFVDPDNGDLPTTVQWYGITRNGDYSALQWKQMYDVLNLLWVTKKDVTWGTRLNPAICELNRRTCAAGSASGSMGQPWSWFESAATCGWGCDCYSGYESDCTPNGIPSDCAFDPETFEGDCNNNACSLKSEDVSLPHAVSGGDNNDTSYGIGLSRGYSYASITGLPTCLSKTVEIWVVADFYENTLPPCDPDCECATNPGCVLNCCDTTHPEDTCYSPTGCHDCCGGCSYVFDNNGDGDFGDGTWGQIVSELVTDGGSTQKYRVGSLSAAPALPPEPGYPSKIQCQDNATGRGYFVTDGVGVVKWQTKFRD